ncbi:MAG: exo-alpha-sialidase [Acidobacteria bacterium]|nr:exo-alpha-sialidase [Acidobacteriota bacterium]
MKIIGAALLWLTLPFLNSYGQALYQSDFIFPPASRGHTHASCLVECPNGDLLAVWYENGPKLSSYEYEKDADKSDDVRIAGARWRLGAHAWGKPFVMSDTFGLSDNNPALIIDHQHRLWLIHSTLLDVPQWTWGSSLLWYKISSDYQQAGPPHWDKVSILVPHIQGLAEVVRKYARGEEAAQLEQRLKDQMARRLGWMLRPHPLILKDGTLLVPLGNENFGVAAMALTHNDGKTWVMSRPVPGIGISQPSVVQLPSGKLVAFFRDGSSDRRIKRSESDDGGLTWSEVRATGLPNPDSGIEALVLRDGHLLMIYNDQAKGRDRLAVSISTDAGKTWKWTRHLENSPGGRFDYPSVIQARDGSLHATYSYNVQTIKYVHFNEAWVRQGDSQSTKVGR